MGRRSGRIARAAIAALLVSSFAAFLTTAAVPQSRERAYRNARAAADRGDLRAALSQAEAALEVAANASDEWTWALRLLRAELLVRQSNAPEARATLRTELPPHVRKSEAAVRRLVALGMIAPDRATAERLFEEARAIAAEHHPALLGGVHLALGNIARTIPEAEQHLRTAARLGREHGNLIAFANANAALARKYAQAERYAEAVEAGEQAVARLTKLGITGRISGAAGNLAWAYFELGDNETAAELFTRAEQAAAAVGDERERTRWLNQLGNVHSVRRDWPAAERYYRCAVASGRAMQHPDVAAFIANLARTSLALGRLGDAARLNAEALALKRASKDAEGEVLSHLLDARIAMVRGEHARAEALLRGVLRDGRRAATRWEAEGTLARLYVRMRRADDADAHFRRAIETVSGARDEVAGELRLSFFNNVADLFDDYVEFLVRAGRHRDALAVTETGRARMLEEGLGVSRSSRQLDASRVARELDATILCYWLGRDRSYVWTITPSAVTVATLEPESAIERAAEAYRRDLLGPRGSLSMHVSRGAQLYRMLVEPALKAAPPGSRVIVIPDGRLHSLNFETLVVPSTSRYWIENVAVTTAASLSLIARGAAARDGAAMLIVGNPPQVEPAFPALRRAGDEIEAVARHFPRRTVLAGADATPAAYRRTAPGTFDFVHFVAHGVATRKRPLDSAVILGRDATQSYRLYARDVLAQPLSARLVTISSCHGAGTRTYAGEGLVGLAWAFLGAGAEQVIAALWEVNDGATPELMDGMYERIRAGEDPATALRHAKLTFVRGKSIYRQPRYWAPFVVYSRR